MGHLFRSETMQLVQLFVQIDAAHDTVDELGKLGVIQFKDLNPEVSPFQRNFVNEVKKADEMARKLRFFEEQINKEKREILIAKHQDPENLALIPLDPIPGEEDKVYKTNELEQKLDELEKEIIEMNSNQDMLNRNFNELIELKHLLTKNTTFFSEVGDGGRDSGIEMERDANSPLLVEPAAADTRTIKLGFVTGLILREKFLAFERVLWRSTRGNLFMKYAEVEEKIKDPLSGEFVEKMYLLSFIKEKGPMQRSRRSANLLVQIFILVLKLPKNDTNYSDKSMKGSPNWKPSLLELASTEEKFSLILAAT